LSQTWDIHAEGICPRLLLIHQWEHAEPWVEIFIIYLMHGEQFDKILNFYAMLR
jgi:hypothetical protein